MPITLNGVQASLMPAITSASGQLESMFSSMQTGGNMSGEGMLAMQFQIQNYTLTLTTASNVTKEMVDTMKNTLQHV